MNRVMLNAALSAAALAAIGLAATPSFAGKYGLGGRSEDRLGLRGGRHL